MTKIIIRNWLEENLPTEWLKVWEPFFAKDSWKFYIAISDTELKKIN